MDGLLQPHANFPHLVVDFTNHGSSQGASISHKRTPLITREEVGKGGVVVYSVK